MSINDWNGKTPIENTKEDIEFFNDEDASVNPVHRFVDLAKAGGFAEHLDNNAVERAANYAAGAIVEGKEWTTEARIIAALVKKLGGSVELLAIDLVGHEGLVIDNTDFGVKIEAQ